MSTAEREAPVVVDEAPQHTAHYGTLEEIHDSETGLPEEQDTATAQQDTLPYRRPERRRGAEDAAGRQNGEASRASANVQARRKKSRAAFRLVSYAASAQTEDDRTREVYQAYYYGAKLPGRAVRGVKRYAYRLFEGVAGTAKRALTTEKAVVAHVLKAALPLLFSIAVLLAALMAILIPTMTVKSELEDLAEAYLYITELDAVKTKEILDAMPHSDGTFYINDQPVSRVLLQTNVDYLLLYLAARYEDFTLDTTITQAVFGGGTVREELRRIHGLLYSHRVVYTTDQEGEPVLDGVYVTSRGVTELLQGHITEDEEEMMTTIASVGIYSAYQCLDMPFEGYAYVEERWGAYVDGDHIAYRNAVALHAMEGGAVKSCGDGIVTDVSGGSVWVEDEDGNRTQYDGLHHVLVTGGQTVEAGDAIGTVSGALYLSCYSEGGKAVNPAFLLPSAAEFFGSGSGDDIVSAALSQVGQAGGQPFWSWYGFRTREDWCACFVSWCADQAEQLQTAVPRFALVEDGAAWYRRRGLWQSGGTGYVPRAGDIIFFDWEPDGSPNHVGIVQGCDGDMVCTVEGNAGDYPGTVCVRYYSLYSNVIYGYGIPDFQ